MAITVDTTHALWVPDEYLAKRAEPSSSSDPKTESKHMNKNWSYIKSKYLFYIVAKKENPSSSKKAAPTSKKDEPASSSSNNSNKPTSTHDKATAKATDKSSSVSEKHSTATVSSGTGGPTMISNSATATISSKPSIPPSTQAENGGSSSAGMIGGIVAAIAVVGVGAAAFLIVRKKKKARQNMRARMSSKPDPFTMGFGNNDPPAAFPPPSAYKTEAAAGAGAFDNYQVTPISENNAEAIQPTAIGSFVVIATYIPTLSDELEIETGDHIELLVEYDDGWCQGVNVTKGHTKGVFPRHCIDYATVPSNHAPNPDFERSKRVSSMIK